MTILLLRSSWTWWILSGCFVSCRDCLVTWTHFFKVLNFEATWSATWPWHACPSHPMSFRFASWASKTSRAVRPNELSCSGLARLGGGNHNLNRRIIMDPFKSMPYHPNAFWNLHAQLQRHYHPSNTSHTPTLKDVNNDHRCGLTNSCPPLSKREASSSEAVAPHWDFLPLPRERKGDSTHWSAVWWVSPVRIWIHCYLLPQLFLF